MIIVLISVDNYDRSSKPNRIIVRSERTRRTARGAYAQRVGDFVTVQNYPTQTTDQRLTRWYWTIPPTLQPNYWPWRGPAIRVRGPNSIMCGHIYSVAVPLSVSTGDRCTSTPTLVNALSWVTSAFAARPCTESLLSRRRINNAASVQTVVVVVIIRDTIDTMTRVHVNSASVPPTI